MGDGLPSPPASSFITLRNYVRVHLGHDPLPRFDNRWLYGDLHYHSQGTDNEGESGYNYRGVVRAMGAMGMDFVFATEHASSSEQIVDVDLDIDLAAEFAARVAGKFTLPFGDTGDTLEESDARIPHPGFLRDMNEARYRHAHRLIYGDKGANQEAAVRAFGLPQNYRSYGVFPQIFLGGEVDAIPEVPRSVVGDVPPRPSGTFKFAEWLRWRPNPMPYGNGLRFDLFHMKDGGVEPVHQLFERRGPVYLMRDFQGLATYDLYGRQHLVYFPRSSALDVGSETTFIPSFTSRYGGATRRLRSRHQGMPPLLREIERKGVAFVAHHLNACDTCSNGPDGVPWTTDLMLLSAYRSPSILGLEFWNEDTRYHSPVCSHEFCRGEKEFTGQEIGYERAEEPTIAGQLPDELKDVGLPLEEYRHGFLAPRTGSLFELRPFDVRKEGWPKRSPGTEKTLHHGSYDWDVMNLRGLKAAGNGELAWLKKGEPRRMFMAGGSDAHGDLNYRRAGYFLGTDDVTDTAIGKPRNLVFAGPPEGPVLFREKLKNTLPTLSPPSPGAISDVGAIGERAVRAHTHEQIIRALRAGRFCVTDGPALRIAIDRNGNGVIDDGDAQMGDSISLGAPSDPFATHAPVAVRVREATLLVEVVSTTEFGSIDTIDIYVGVDPEGALASPNSAPQARVYAPRSHGVRGAGDPKGVRLEGDQFHAKLPDGYWQDDRLRFRIPSGALRFSSSMVLQLDSFEAGAGVAANRFFIRAFASTRANEDAFRPARYAFSNPIWLHRSGRDLLLH
ncbi:MAG TPA: hypothetical protein VF432_22250 [Thermoanaerobaculia bacterium]